MRAPAIPEFSVRDTPPVAKAREPESHRPYSAHDKGQTLHPSVALQKHIVKAQSQPRPPVPQLNNSFRDQPVKGRTEIRKSETSYGYLFDHILCISRWRTGTSNELKEAGTRCV